MSETKGKYMVNGQDHILLNDLKEQATKLKNAIDKNFKNKPRYPLPMTESTHHHHFLHLYK